MVIVAMMKTCAECFWSQRRGNKEFPDGSETVSWESFYRDWHLTGLVRAQISICQVVGKRWHCWGEDGVGRGTRAGSWYTGIFNCWCPRSSEEGEKPGSQGWFLEKRILLNGGIWKGTPVQKTHERGLKVNMAEPMCEWRTRGIYGRGAWRQGRKGSSHLKVPSMCQALC